MNVEIIAVGTELLLGQIANTNGQFLSQRLASIGANVYYQTVVGDNLNRLHDVINIGKQRSDVLIFTGGLGPTEDDLTKECVAMHFQRKLIIHEKTLKDIEAYFKKINRVMTDNNRKQAHLIEGSIPLLNDHGMAVGCFLSIDNCLIILLPGPPKEMKPMFTQYVESLLLKHYGKEEVIYSKMLRFFGIGESILETKVFDLLTNQNPTVAPLAAEGEVALRLTAKAGTIEQAKKLIEKIESEIQSRVGVHIYGADEETLPQLVVSKLQNLGKTISFAESITGGLTASMITDVSGASEVISGSLVCYSNEVKSHVLGVGTQTLQSHGAISRECAQEMAQQVKKMFQSTIGVGITGVAGPALSEGKPVGTVFLGIAMEGQETEVYELAFAGTREQIRLRAAKTALYYILKKS